MVYLLARGTIKPPPRPSSFFNTGQAQNQVIFGLHTERGPLCDRSVAQSCVIVNEHETYSFGWECSVLPKVA